MPPPNACPHQKMPQASRKARMGFSDSGERCCQVSVPPTCFLINNDKDKGGKSSAQVTITLEGHKIMSLFLTTRNKYFELNPDVDLSRISGDSPFFLNSKGKLDPRKTSNLRLGLFNKAVFGPSAGFIITPQKLRAWATTILAMHPDSRISAVRGDATGNTEGVYQEHYNLARQAGVLDALMTAFRKHNKKSGEVSFSQDFEYASARDKEAVELANYAVMLKPDGVDLTSRSKPIHRHLRNQFEEELDRLDSGLWSKAGHSDKCLGLSEMKWIRQVLNVLGRQEGESLRDIIIEQYRGMEDVQKRQWSSLRTHLEVMKKNDFRNCPLMLTLRQFYSSAKSKNKKEVTLDVFEESASGSGGDSDNGTGGGANSDSDVAD